MTVLDQDLHARLIADQQHICETANIPRAMLDKSATEFCGDKEIDWLRHFQQNKEECRGLILVGDHTPSPEVRMMAMTAALLRNFIDSRVVALNTVIDWTEQPEHPEPSVIMIPNLYGRHQGRTLPSFKIQALYDLLLSRFTSCRLTVGYVDSLEALRLEYGQTFYQHLLDHYVLVGEGE